MNAETPTRQIEDIPVRPTIEQEDKYIQALRSNPERAKEVYTQNVRAFIEAEIAAGATLQEIGRMHSGRSLSNGTESNRLELSRKALSGIYNSEERTRISEGTFESVLADLRRTNGEKIVETVRENLLTNQLGYQDADIPEEAKAETLDFVRSSQSAIKYADTLAEMTAQRNLSEYVAVAQQMVAECKNALDRLGINPTPYSASKTWAMWDIGKQYYFSLHPDEADLSYRIADPIADSAKHMEIVDRHVGWEAYAAWQGGERDFLQRCAENRRPQISEYLERQPKDNGTLSSKELAELGALLRI